MDVKVGSSLSETLDTAPPPSPNPMLEKCGVEEVFRSYSTIPQAVLMEYTGPLSLSPVYTEWSVVNTILSHLGASLGWSTGGAEPQGFSGRHPVLLRNQLLE